MNTRLLSFVVTFVAATARRLWRGARSARSLLTVLVAAGALPGASVLLAQDVTTLWVDGNPLSSIGGIATGAAGTLFVTDNVAHVVYKLTINAGTGVVSATALAGMANVPGSTDGTGTNARFSYPYGVVAGADGSLYVAEYGNNLIRKITVGQSGLGTVSTLAGTAFAGSTDGAGATAMFRGPLGMAVGSDGTLYVADSMNNKIRKIAIAQNGTATVSTLAGDGTTGSANGAGATAQFNQPAGVAVGPDGTVYVSDTYNHTIRKITVAQNGAATVSLLAGSGQQGYAEGAGASARFYYPEGIALGADGAVYVGDNMNHRIRKITVAQNGVATVSTSAGSGIGGTLDGTGLAAWFRNPTWLAMGPDGALYVGQPGDRAIRKIAFGDPTTTALSASPATVTSGTSVTLTATVTHQPPSGSAVTPTGTVTFNVGATTLGTATLNGSGVATLAVDSATLAEGVSTVTASYGGRMGGALPNLAVSTSTGTSLAVNRAPTLTGAATSAVFTPGTAGSFQFTATGYPAPTFTTASTLPPGVTLSSGGLLSGTAAGVARNYAITVTASNGTGTATQSFTVVVTSPPVFSSSATLNTVAGSPVSVRLAAAGFPAETNANLFTNDFSAAALPNGWTKSGTASLTGGLLQLTPAANNSRGIVTLPAVGAASPTGFSARFNLIVSNAAGADGLSFNYGALLTGATLDATASLETGMVAAGLVITFGEYGEDRMEVRYNNKILSQVYVPCASAAGKPVEVTVTPLGLLTLTVDGVPITTVNLGADYVAAAKSTWQFAFAARTGGANSQHAIDDLAIDALQIAYGTTANYVESTFGAALPTGWTLFGHASLDTANNELILTPNAGSKAGALVLPALGGASPTAFSAQFDYRAADGSGADGTSFNYGVIPASPVGTDAGFATAGLIVQMTEYGTDRILIKYDGTTLATGNVTLLGSYRRVSIDVAADGTIAVSVNGVVAVSATLPAGYASATKTAWQFALGAKTGGATDKHSLRNFSIARPRGLPAGLTLDPVGGLISGLITNPAAANYPVTAVATNAYGVTVSDVTLANGPLTSLSPTFATGADVGLSRGFFTESGVTLGTITLGFAPRPGQKLLLFQNTGAAASTGRFTGLAEGATVTATYNGDTFTFAISYTGGTGNDVTLTRVYGIGQAEGGAIVSTFAGTAGAFGLTNATGAAARFNLPTSVAVGADGAVYVAEYYNHDIRRITAAGVVTTLAGSGFRGTVNGTGAEASFSYPSGVAVGADNTVYVADSLGNKIRKVTAAGVVTTLAGAGYPGYADGTGVMAVFNNPNGVAVGADGTVYVADTINNKIRKVTAAGVVTTLAGSGAMGSVDGTGAAASFTNPNVVAVGSDGTLYVADSSKIRKVTAAGVVTTLAGSGFRGNVDGTGAAASFSYPSGVAVGADNTVYVADSSSNRIRKVTAAGVVTTLAGSGAAGSVDGTGAAASFYAPNGIAVGADGTVYVADRSNQTIRKIALGDARPFVTTTAATSVTGSGATLNGTVNPNGFVTAAQFEYGLTDALGSTAAVTLSPTNGTTAQTIAAPLTGLTLSSTYYYRLTAVNVDGTAVTTAGTFTTPAVSRPVLADLPTSSAITATSATLRGNVTSDGGSTITSRGFLWNQAGSATIYVTPLVNGTTGAYSFNLTGLQSGTTYQYRAYASNSVGNGFSSFASFTTPRSATVPWAPASLTAGVGGTSVTLTFAPGENGGVTITNYEVSFDNGATWQAMSPATSAPPLTLTGLTPGVTYQVKVRAVNSVGAGDASTAVAVTAPTTLAITSAASASGTYGTAFSYQVAGNGAPTAFSATGLPAGLSINASTGALTGTPTQTGLFTADLTIATATASAHRALEITIAKKALTVSADAKSRAYGQEDPAFTATLSGFVGSDTAAVVSGEPKFSVASNAASAAGTYAITPSLGSLAASNYSFGPFTAGTLTIATQAATVTLGDLTQTYSGTARPVKVTTAPAGLPVSLAYAGTGGTVYAASATAPTNVGTYTVAATVTDANYSGTAAGTLAVTAAKASQTITIAPLPSSVALNTLASVTISASASSGLPVTFGLGSGSPAGVGLSAAGSPSSLTSLNGTTGSVTLTATQAGDANYDPAAPATATFDVTKSNQNIAFTGPADQVYNAASPTLTLAATASSGLAVTLTVDSGPATVSGTTLTLTGAAGQVVVRAAQGGDGTCNPAPDVVQSFWVGRQRQTVTFGALGTVAYGVAPLTLAASADSGLTVTYAVITGPAAVAGSTLTITGAGEVTVQASQAGDATYNPATPVARTFTVSPLALTVTGAVAQPKTYDGTNTAVVTGATLSPVVGADLVSLGGTSAGTFAQAGAGNSLAVTTAMTLVGADAANYTLTQPTGLTAHITKKSLQVGGVTVADKVYDGLLTASASYAAASVVGLVGSDTVTLDASAATASFADQTAGEGKTVTIAGLALANSGAAANYTLAQPTAAATILRKTLLVTGAVAANRAYNGSPAATVSYISATLSGLVTGDAVTLDAASATALFDDRMVGVDRSVQVAGLALTGNDHGNYRLGQPTLSAAITPKAITVTGVTASNKPYDKLTTATVVTTGAALVGVESADAAAVTLVTTDATGEFADAELGANKTVTVSGLTLTGAEAANYTVTQPTTTASITGSAVTVTGIVGYDKLYDGTVDARVGVTSATLVGVSAGSGVSLDATNVTAAFVTATVGTNKTVQVAGLVLSGPNAGNYTLVPPTTTATITPMTASLSGVTVANKIYNGTTAATAGFTRVELTGLLAGETVSVVTSAATAAFADKVVGTGKAVTLAGLTLTGAQAANYTLSLPTLSADITPKALTVTGITVADRLYDGTVAVTPSYAGATLVGVVTGDTVTLDSSGALASLADPAVGTGKAVTFTGLSLGGADADNYTLTPPVGTVRIAPVSVPQTITFGPLADRLGNSDSFTLTATASSGLPVCYRIVSGPALLAGAEVSLTGIAGTVVIVAAQTGSAEFDPAPEVTVSFVVSAAKTHVYFGTVRPAGSDTATGDLAAAIPPNSRQGSLLIVAPGLGLNTARGFTLDADGYFTVQIAPDSNAGARAATQSPGFAGAPRKTAVGVALTILGRLSNGVLQGVIEPLGLTFSAPVLPVDGPSAGVAGFYQSPNLATASGTTYSVVGTDRQVLVLTTTAAVTTGGLTTLGADGSFSLQTQTGAGAATIRGQVDAASTTVSGSVSLAGTAPTTFAGIASTTTRTDRLINLSTRGQVGGGRTLITGFVVGGATPKRVLLRAVGPTLANFGVGQALVNPQLKLFDATGQVIAQNDDWSGADTSAAVTQVGAFSLAAGTQDAALLATLAPGVYTMHVADHGGTGVALAEIYDASSNPNADYQRLINMSSRGEVGGGEDMLICGFIITGNSPKRVLVRAVGPGLTPFGVTGALADPRLRVFAGSTLIGENDNWSAVPAAAATTAQAAVATGAFGLTTGSKDAAFVITLQPGAYTGQVSSADGTSTGTALVEIYELP